MLSDAVHSGKEGRGRWYTHETPRREKGKLEIMYIEGEGREENVFT